MRRLVLVAALGLNFPGVAFGLSCARPSLDETAIDAAIDAAIMIFEGTAGPKRSLDLREKEAVRLYAIEAIFDSAEDLKVYGFTVTQGWKGATTGQSIDVLFNSYWGESRYEGVTVELFEPNQNQAITKVVTETLQARKRMIADGPKNWSLAILVPTKRMTRLVSSVFREPRGNLPRIEHHAAVDLEAAILAAEIIAFGLQSHGTAFDMEEFIPLIANYFRGKGGDTPSKTNLQDASRILAAYHVAIERRQAGKEVHKNSVFLPIEAAIEGLSDLTPTGDPNADWVIVRGHFVGAGCKRLEEIATEVRNIRLLDRGTQLREELS